MKKAITGLFLLSVCSILFGNEVPTRTGVCLNGNWKFTPKDQQQTFIKVPDYWDTHEQFENVSQATYEREIVIPSTEEWKNKQYVLEFKAVNFIADVYVNEQHVKHHVGGWIGFSADISSYVKPGEKAIIRVEVKGGNHEPIVDEKGVPQQPVGFFGQNSKWGIVFDVWLRAYGKTHVSDAFIQTSVRQQKLLVDYSLTNTSGKHREIKIVSKVVPVLNVSETALLVESPILAMKPGKSTKYTLESEWKNPHLWSPGDPFLYYLQIQVVDAATGEVLDSERRRFGFREIWVDKTRIMLNGQRLTILGANIVMHSEFYKDQNYFFLSRESWNSTIDRLFELNFNAVRFHMQPAPGYLLHIADERGLLILDESAIYAREFMYDINKKEYLKNCYTWIASWVKDRRNHPSVIIWNAENEMGVGWLNWMTDKEILSLGDEIRKYDTTRPVNYDGDRDVGDQLVNLHYPESYKSTVDTSIYAWTDTLHPDKPTGIGEFITHYGEYGIENQWWMGTFIRGLRYLYFSDIRPYRHDWAIIPSENTPCIDNLRNSQSPVALFDKQYDDKGIYPLLYKNYPIFRVGDTVQRELILYNDEFADTVITIEVLMKSSETHQALYNYNGDHAPKQRIVAEATKTYFVPLGEHVKIPYTLVIPDMYTGFLDQIEIELIARKKGQVKFRETLKFALRSSSTETKVTAEPGIELSEAEQPDFFGR